MRCMPRTRRKKRETGFYHVVLRWINYNNPEGRETLTGLIYTKDLTKPLQTLAIILGEIYLSTSFRISLSVSLSRPVPCAIWSNVKPILYKLIAVSFFSSRLPSFLKTSAIVILSDSSNRYDRLG